jgi:hypothetical protein
MFLNSAHIVDLFCKLYFFRQLGKRFDIIPEDETSYSTQNHEIFLNYVKNEYCAKHQIVLDNKPESVPSRDIITSTMALGSGQSSFNPPVLSRNDEDYLTAKNEADTTPRQSDCTTR